MNTGGRHRPRPRVVALGLALGVAALIGGAGRAAAHRFDPALLDLAAHADGRVDVRWRVGLAAPAGLRPRFSSRCRRVGPARRWRDSRARVLAFSMRCGAAGLWGLQVWADGRDVAGTDVIVRFGAARPGQRQPRAASPPRGTRVLRADQRSLTLPAPRAAVAGGAHPAWIDTARRYAALGVRHILAGYDHVLLLLGLLALALLSGSSTSTSTAGARRWRTLAGVVTAFTVGHSLSVCAAALGVVALPRAPIEACIALSLVLLAVEVIGAAAAGDGRPRSGLWRRPWLLAGALGLLHGFGLADGLRAAGLPDGALALALAAFNIGVELGQLALIAAALTLLAVARGIGITTLAQRAPRACAYVVGAVGVFATLDRVVGML